jgi:menaquinone-9 beta-reductase
MTTYDVAIVGCGPAGAAAAITAARHGLKAVVIDKATFPRDKTCGDGLTANALRLLEQLGLRRDTLVGEGGYRAVSDLVIVGPNQRVVNLPLPRSRGDYAATVSRLRLDNALSELVTSTQCDRITAEVVDVINAPNSVTALLSDGQRIEAANLIAADGHWSNVRRVLQPNSPRDLGEWHAVRQYFANAGDDKLWVSFEPDLLPGYFWVFPLPDGRANVGYGVLRAQGRSGKELKALWPDLLARPHIQRILGRHATPIDTVRAWPIPTRYERDTVTSGRVLFVGDAARVVDPMTGEGIAQAIETGMLAIAAIASSSDTPATYRQLVQRAIGRDLRFAGVLQRVLSYNAGTRAALRVVDYNAWTRRNFARWMFEDYPRAVLGTPDRWRSHPFSQPGAFLDSPRRSPHVTTITNNGAID